MKEHIRSGGLDRSLMFDTPASEGSGMCSVGGRLTWVPLLDASIDWDLNPRPIISKTVMT